MLLDDALELHVLDQGRGPAIVLLHGGMGDVYAWEPQRTAFAGSYRVISYSRRYSFPNRNRFDAARNSCAADVADLDALLARLNCLPAHLVGTSYGALVALAYALAHPRNVRTLVLAEPPLHQWLRQTPAGVAVFRAFIDEVWTPARRAFDHGHARRAMEILFDGISGRPLFATLPREVMAPMLRNAGAMAATVRMDDPFPDLPRDRVGALELPLLLVQGARSEGIHLDVNAEFARVVPQAELARIPGSGHGSARENPDAFNAVVLDFLARRG